jgi:hypothetical protein
MRNRRECDKCGAWVEIDLDVEELERLWADVHHCRGRRVEDTAHIIRSALTGQAKKDALLAAIADPNSEHNDEEELWTILQLLLAYIEDPDITKAFQNQWYRFPPETGSA